MKLTTKNMMALLRRWDDDATEKLGGMTLMDTDILVAAATGKLDLNQVAALIVAARGVGRGGDWVGHLAAQQQMDRCIEKLAARQAKTEA